jgi:hypothetical protein
VTNQGATIISRNGRMMMMMMIVIASGIMCHKHHHLRHCEQDNLHPNWQEVDRQLMEFQSQTLHPNSLYVE